MSPAPALHHVGICAIFLLVTAGCTQIQDTVGVVNNRADDGGACASGVPLKQRPEGETVTLVDGQFGTTTDASWPLMRQGDYVTLKGQGYLTLAWQIEYTLKAGLITLPTFTAISGTFLYVGGGGGKNLGDPKPGTTGTWMGNAQDGLSYMPPGDPTPWQNDFYYLDGQVTIAIQETNGLYNLIVSAQTYAQVATPGSGVYDPGIVCDPA